jgi:beta-galactosidase
MNGFQFKLIVAIGFSCVFGLLWEKSAQGNSPIPTGVRQKYNFNSNWKMFVGDPQGASAVGFDDSNWRNVQTPHAWNEDDAFRKAIRDLPTGIAWYRKHFKLPPSARDRKVFLEFEGIRHGGEFYLNGVFIGRHENGVMAFGFDITQHVKAAPLENVLAVRIDNAWDYREKSTNSTYQWSDRNFYANYGGINKNVYLHITDKLYQTLPLYSNLGTTGVYIYAREFDIPRRSATVTAEAEVKNEYSTSRTFKFQVSLADMNGRIVKTMHGGQFTLMPGATRVVRTSARVANLNFWSWGYGYLYSVNSTLIVDQTPLDTVTTRTGFRKAEFADGVVKLNDRVIQLKGYAQRTTNEWPAVGSAVPAWLSDFSNQLMVESNANLVRWMHVTPWKQDVESCDRVGLMQAMPAGDSERDVDGRRWEQRVELMRDAIIYNRNNPSIVFYESGNKGVSEDHIRQMKALRDKHDPYGGRAAGSREMLESKVAEYGGEMLYINKSAAKPLWATEYSRDEGLRKYWDEFSPPFHKDGEGPLYRDQDASAYNRNQDSHAIENVVRWFDYWRERPGTGRRVSAGGVNIVFSDTNTHSRGAENYRRSGEVDAMRIPKGGFFAHQVMWDGWVDVERLRTHIIGHWNYARGTKKNVYVVSSGEKVELFVNGVSQGLGHQGSRFLFTFKNVAWESGVVRAVAHDRRGRIVSEDSRKTAGDPVAIRLKTHTGSAGLQSNGDLALIDVEVIDSQGNRCPTALNMISFTVSGPAEWRGGIAQGPDNHILSKQLPVEGGINRVLIRTLPAAGPITVTATSDSLKSSTLQLTSRAVSITDGLSLDFPGDKLASNLRRGPTPKPAILSATRREIQISTASAGSNAAQVATTFDDDETTDWSSDGTLKSAWIKYDFSRAAIVNEVVLKLVAWRTQSYPIRIWVDDKVVFTGTTERSLGYVTINLKPTLGKSLKIELVGAANNRDAFGNIIEIPGTPDPNSAAGRRTTKDILGIVEIEIYGPPGKM